MLGTIANALAARVGRTPGRVGFALGWKLLLWYPIFYFGKVADFHSQRGIWREMMGRPNPAWGLSLSVCSD
jgi:hypothetical protein